jgi:hypothetical protein
MSVIKIKDDLGNWVPIERVIKSSQPPVIINTAIFQVPASGGEFWVDTAAVTTVDITLPLNPSSNTVVSFQIVDSLSRDVFVRAFPGNFLAFQTAGALAKYAGTSRNLIEEFRFYNSRWVQCYGRYIYI